MARAEPLKSPGFTLFLGNLDSRVTDKLLYELGCQAGPVDQVRINSGGAKPYAFIKYRDLAGAMYAVALLRGRVRLFDMPLSINFSNQPVPQEEWSSEDAALWAKCLVVLSAEQAAGHRRDAQDLPPLAPRSAGRQQQQQGANHRDHRSYDEEDDYERRHPRSSERQRVPHSYASPGSSLQQWSPAGTSTPAPAAAAPAAEGGGGRDRADRGGGYADYSTPGSGRYVQDAYQQHGAGNGYSQQHDYQRQYQQQQQVATPYGHHASMHHHQQQQATPGAYSAATPGTPASPYLLQGVPAQPAAAAGAGYQQQQYGGQQLQWQVQPLGQAAATGTQYGSAGGTAYTTPGTTPTYTQQQYGQQHSQHYQQPAQQQQQHHHHPLPGGFQAAGLALSQATGTAAYSSPAAAIPGLGAPSPYPQQQQQPPPPPAQAYPPAPAQQQQYPGGFQGAYQQYGYR